MSGFQGSSNKDVEELVKKIAGELERRKWEKALSWKVTCMESREDGSILIGTSDGSLILVDDFELEETHIDQAHKGRVTCIKALELFFFTSGEDSQLIFWKDNQKVAFIESKAPIDHFFIDSHQVWVADNSDSVSLFEFSETEGFEHTPDHPLLCKNPRLSQFCSYQGKKAMLFYHSTGICFRNLTEKQEIININAENVTILLFIHENNSILYAEEGLEAKIVSLSSGNSSTLQESNGTWNFSDVFEAGVVVIGGSSEKEGPCCKFWDLVSMTCVMLLKFNSLPVLFVNPIKTDYFFLYCEGHGSDLVRVRKQEKTINRSFHFEDEVTEFFSDESQLVVATAGEVLLIGEEVKTLHRNKSKSPISLVCCLQKRIAWECDGNICYVDLGLENRVQSIIQAKNPVKLMTFGKSKDFIVYVEECSTGNIVIFKIIVFQIWENFEVKPIPIEEKNIFQIGSVKDYLVYTTDTEVVFLSPDLTERTQVLTFAKGSLKICINLSVSLIVCAGDNEIVDMISLSWSTPENILLEKGISSSFSTESKKRRTGHLIGFYKNISSVSLNSNEKFLIVGKSDGLQIWNLKDEVLVWKFKFRSTNLKIRTNSNQIFYSNSTNIVSFSDPSIAKTLEKTREMFNIKGVVKAGLQKFIRRHQDEDFPFILLGPSSSSLYFLAAIEGISHKRIRSRYNYRVYQWVAFPDCINMLHVFVLLKNKALIEKAFEDGCPFIRMTDGRSPLSIALELRNREIIEIVLAKVVEIAENNPKILASIEEDLSNLNNFSPPSLSMVYSLAFPVVSQRGLKNYGNLIDKSGVVITSPSYMIDENKFLMLKGETLEEISIVFRVSAFRMNLALGSLESLKFIDSLNNCSDNEVFRTQLVRSIILYKWRQVKKFVLLHDIFYVIISFFTLYYVGYSVSFDWISTIIIFATNSLFLVNEIMQVCIGFKSYMNSLWNFIDLARVLCCYMFLVVKYQFFYGNEKSTFDTETHKKIYQIIVISLVLLFLLRGLSLFELFDRTRSMIKVFRDIIKDSLVFLLVLAMTTSAFTCLFMILDENLNFFDAFTTTYSINFGAFKLENYSSTTDPNRQSFTLLACFLLATLINPLLMVNLLVSIFNDTFARLKDNLVIEDLKALAELLSEHEPMAVWGRAASTRHFIQICSQESVDESQDDRRARKIQQLAEKVTLIKEEVSGLVQAGKKELEWFEKTLTDNRKQEIDLIEKVKREEASLKSFITRSRTLK